MHINSDEKEKVCVEHLKKEKNITAMEHKLKHYKDVE